MKLPPSFLCCGLLFVTAAAHAASSSGTARSSAPSAGKSGASAVQPAKKPQAKKSSPHRFPTWAEQQAKAENQTARALKAFPDVRSDRYVYKTVTLPNGEKLALDLRIERPKEGGPFPVVFYVHGGAWVTGNKGNFYRQSFRMASENKIAGVRMEYRWKSQGGNFDNVMGDVMDAIDFIRQRAQSLNLDFSRVGLAGSSAGGHLAGIAAQLTPECISFDGFNGIYDLVDRNQSRFGGDTAFIGSTTAEKKKASAFYNIRKNPPDTWLYHGTADVTIDIEQSRRFAKAIRKRGGNARMLTYKGYGHGVNRLDPASYEATTKALLAHTAYVFGLRDRAPNPEDYIVSRAVKPPPEGFLLEGLWRQKSNPKRTFLFRPDHTAKGTNGDEIGWKRVGERFYIIWKSGRLGSVKILDASTVKMASATFVKDSAK